MWLFSRWDSPHVFVYESHVHYFIGRINLIVRRFHDVGMRHPSSGQR